MRLSWLLVFLAESALAQVAVEGSVRDKETGEPVVGAHVIGISKRGTGTSTNAEGTFVLHALELPDSIRISCIGYRTVVVRGITPGKAMEISLRPHVISLEALTVKAPSPTQLIRDAVKAMQRNYGTPPLQIRGFYREIIRKEQTYYSVAEAIFESQLPGRNDEALLQLIQGRRSESVTATRIFEDYHPGGGPNYLVNHLLEAQVPVFLSADAFDDYTFTIDSITAYEGKDVYIIGFDQRDGLKKNLWKGSIYIEAESLAIIDLTYAFSEKGIEYRKHLSTADNIMASLLGIDYTVLRRTHHYSYRQANGRWRMHEASLEMDIHFRQPRKDIDENFTLQAQLLSLGQQPGPLTPFDKDEVWRKNRLVKNLPGEFDEKFWGADNILRPEASLTAAVAQMDVLRKNATTTGPPDGWNLFHAPEVKVYRQKNAFLLKPYVMSRWKDEEKGPFLWKNVTGDFDWTARIRVTKAQDTTSAPGMGFQVGALMIRNVQGDSENHILFGIGCMGNPQLKLVSQHTIKGNSAIYVTKVQDHASLLRLRRRGTTVELLSQSGQSDWTLIRKFTLSDWPADVQYGIAGFAFVPGSGPRRNPDLLIKAGEILLTPMNP